MGTVYATITLKNLRDINLVESGYKTEDEIRQATVETVVDTGAPTLCITEEISRLLGLEIKGERPATMANGVDDTVKIAGPVELHWKDRSMICQLYVVPGGKEILLGSIPLEYMDLIVDPVRLELAGAHGDGIVHSLPSVRW